MYFKGIVVDSKDNYSIVMKDDSTMARIKNREGLKEGDAILFLEDDIYEKVNNKIPFNKIIGSIMATAAIIIILIMPIAYKDRDNVYAVVSIDVNPSIQVDIDTNKKIVKVKGLNEDGKNLNLNKVIGMKLENGLNEIKMILEKAQYKVKGDSVLIGFTLIENDDDVEYSQEVKNVIKKSFEGTTTAYLSSNKRDLEEANKQGLSLGRYLAKLKINSYSDIDIENLSVEQILNMLKNEKYLYLHEEAKVDLKDKIEDNKEDIDEKHKTNVIEVEGDNKDGDKVVDEKDESNQTIESDTSVINKQDNNNQENNSQKNDHQEDQDDDNHQENDNYNDERHNGKHNKDKNPHGNKNNHNKNKNKHKHTKDKNYGGYDDDDDDEQ